MSRSKSKKRGRRFRVGSKLSATDIVSLCVLGLAGLIGSMSAYNSYRSPVDSEREGRRSSYTVIKELVEADDKPSCGNQEGALVKDIPASAERVAKTEEFDLLAYPGIAKALEKLGRKELNHVVASYRLLTLEGKPLLRSLLRERGMPEEERSTFVRSFFKEPPSFEPADYIKTISSLGSQISGDDDEAPLAKPCLRKRKVKAERRPGCRSRAPRRA